jgi:hypothetical protein
MPPVTLTGARGSGPRHERESVEVATFQSKVVECQVHLLELVYETVRRTRATSQCRVITR